MPVEHGSSPVSKDPDDIDAPDRGGTSDVDPEEVAVGHVLQEVYPDRREATAIGSAPADDHVLVGVQAAPRGYFSTAKYALVTVDADGTVVDAETTTRSGLQRRLDAARE